MVIIKKYGNRRLYDTSASRYVNLEDIASLIRKGQEVRVVDATTNQDLTRVILTQIITEDARDKPTGLPLELLRQLIVATDQAGHEFIMWYLRSAFDTYQKVQTAMQNRLGEMQTAVMSPVQTMRRVLGMAGADLPGAESELESLRGRVAELEARLEKTRPKATGRSRRAKPRRK